jgi:hypothetical protein
VRDQTPGEILQAIGTFVRNDVGMLRRRDVEIDPQVAADLYIAQLLLNFFFGSRKGKTSTHLIENLWLLLIAWCSVLYEKTDLQNSAQSCFSRNLFYKIDELKTKKSNTETNSYFLVFHNANLAVT